MTNSEDISDEREEYKLKSTEMIFASSAINVGRGKYLMHEIIIYCSVFIWQSLRFGGFLLSLQSIADGTSENIVFTWILRKRLLCASNGITGVV